MTGIAVQENKRIVCSPDYIHAALCHRCPTTKEILDLECVLCHVIGEQHENKNAVINPPCSGFIRGALYTKGHGASLICPNKSAILNS